MVSHGCPRKFHDVLCTDASPFAFLLCLDLLISQGLEELLEFPFVWSGPFLMTLGWGVEGGSRVASAWLATCGVACN